MHSLKLSDNGIGRMMAALLAIVCCACACEGSNEGGGENPDIVPEAPAAARLVEAGETMLEFAWDAVADAVSYNWKLLKGMTLVKDGSGPDTGARIEGLESGTAYRFAVKSIGKSGQSAYSGYVEASTKVSGGSGENPDPGPGPDPIEDVYSAMKIPASEEDGIARAFPGAEGGGMFTTGGRGGKVLHVTTLEDLSTEGSLRWAVAQKYPRTVVFDVAGTITLKSPLEIKYGDLTIAGQTAPGDGICIKGRYTRIEADNIIIRFVRFRLGDEDPNASDSDDAIWGRYHKDIILDHCSMSWCIDECASFYANANFTMQWCFITESMRSSVHSKGDHGYGGIWGGSNASFHHNLLAHHDSRNPRIDHPHIYEDHNSVPNRGTVDFRNNVIYNWGSNNTYGGEGYGHGKGTGINVIGNCYKPGPSSTDRAYFFDAYAVYASCSSCGKNIEEGYPLLYLEGNLHTAHSDISADNASGIYWHNKDGHTGYGETSDVEFAIKAADGKPCSVTTHTASDAFDAVCAYGGCSLKRDKVDARNASDAQKGSGKIIDCVTATSGKVSVEGEFGYTWPQLRATEEELARASADRDADGIPDWYENLLGLDPADASDANAISIDRHGRYTNLEMYLHYLVKDIVEAQNSTGTYKTQQ